MAIYVSRDIDVEDNGDLVISDGDLAVATARDSIQQYLLTWSMAGRGSFLTTPEVGWGAEGFIGRPNIPFTHEAMQRDLGYSYSIAPDLSLNDLIYTASYINRDVAAITVRFNGMVVEPDGTSPSDGIVLTFSFPFHNGQIQQEVQQ